MAARLLLSLLAQTDVWGIVSAVLPVVAALVGGLLAMAWRLGGLERSVKDMQGDITEIRDELRGRR